jgi:hypothetical protein
MAEGLDGGIVMASVKAKVVTVRSGSRASKVYVRPSGQGGKPRPRVANNQRR